MRFVKWAFLILLLLLGIGYGVKVYMQDKYKDVVLNYILDEITTRLTTRVDVGDFDFEVFNKFPYASIVFTNIYGDAAQLPNHPHDTLFHFEKAYFHLNLLDIYKGNYQINQIEVTNGYLHIEVDKAGNPNYRIFKEQPGEDQKADDFILGLDEVILNNINFRMLDYQNGLMLDVTNKLSTISGGFFNDEISLQTNINAYCDYLKFQKTALLSEREVQVSGGLAVFDNYTRYQLKEGNLTIDNKLNFTAAGTFSNALLDLKINGNRLNVAAFIGLLPKTFSNQIKHLDGDGIVAFQSTLSGDIGNKKMPVYKADFSVENATITNKNNGYQLSDLFFVGSFTNGYVNNRYGEFSIDSMGGKLMGNEFISKFSIKDFYKPTIAMFVKGDFELSSLQFFQEFKEVELLSGSASINAKGELSLTKPDKLLVEDLLKASVSGNIKLSDLGFNTKLPKKQYQNISGELVVYDNLIRFKDVKGQVATSKFILKGVIKNLLPSIFKEEEGFELVAAGKLNRLDLNDWLVSNESTDSSASESIFPPYSTFLLNVEVDSMKYNRFLAHDVSTQMQFDRRGWRIERFSSDAFEGRLEGNAYLIPGSVSPYTLHIEAEAEDVDVSTLFNQANNFGQSFLTSTNLSGRATGEIVFNADVTEDFEILTESVRSVNNIQIVNGRLKEYDQLQEIADYFDKNVLLRKLFKSDEMKSKLADITFSELSNEIEISNEVVRIPKMEIKSSFMDINLLGQHSFDNVIHYEFDFKLSEFMSRDGEPVETEFGEIEESESGGKIVYLIVDGTVDDFEVSLNKDAARAERRKQRDEEKAELKELLKEEFSAKNTQTNEVEEADFQMQFEEETSPKNTTESSTEKANNESKTQTDTTAKKQGLKGLLNRIAGEEEKKKAPEIEFDEDL